MKNSKSNRRHTLKCAFCGRKTHGISKDEYQEISEHLFDSNGESYLSCERKKCLKRQGFLDLED